VKEEMMMPKTLNHNTFYRMKILRREKPWSSRWKWMEWEDSVAKWIFKWKSVSWSILVM